MTPHSAKKNTLLFWFGHFGQITRIGYILGGARPLLREGGPIGYHATPSDLVSKPLTPDQVRPAPRCGRRATMTPLRGLPRRQQLRQQYRQQYRQQCRQQCRQTSDPKPSTRHAVHRDARR